jgi:hypothetical protein
VGGEREAAPDGRSGTIRKAVDQAGPLRTEDQPGDLGGGVGRISGSTWV